jgi:signal transduction histidine kinase
MLIYVLSIVVGGIALYKFLRLLSESHQTASYLMAAALILIAILIRNDVFRLFESTLLFSPALYASGELLNSFGEFITLAVIIGLVTNAIRKKLDMTDPGHLKQETLTFSILAVSSGLYMNLVLHLADGLVFNSRISFDIRNALSFDVYTFLGYSVIALIIHNLYSFSGTLVEQLKRSSGGIRSYATYILMFVAGTWLGCFLFAELFEKTVSAWSLIMLIAAIVSGVAIKSLVSSEPGILNILSRAVIYSVITTIIVLPAVENKESESVKLYASRLENERDLIAEYLAGDVIQEVLNDEKLQILFGLPPDSIIRLYADGDNASDIVSQYFASGYWSRYDILIRSFYKSYLPLNAAGDPSWDSQYFEELIETGTPALSDGLYFTGAENEKYIARLILPSVNGPPNVIYIVFREKAGRKITGFPGLLLSGNVFDEQEQARQYSYAVYENNNLVRNAGTYGYRNTLSGSFSIIPDTLSEVDEEAYTHTFTRTDEKTVVVTRPASGILSMITFFAYLFWLYVAVILIYYLLSRKFHTDERIVFNYKTRIQLTIISVVIAAFFIIGVSSVLLFRDNFRNNTFSQADSKLSLLKSMLSDELARRSLENMEVTDDMYGRLSELSGLIDNDFNLFGLDGELVYSSQPKVYEYGLIGAYMDPYAYMSLSVEGEMSFKQYERIGQLEYLSAYEPVRSEKLNTIGYINLPFFAKEEQLKADIANFLIAMINIYVLLLFVAVLIAVLISNRITKPLQIIQVMMSKLRYGSGNEQIEWKQKDEIGTLIDQYNLMVDELEESARKLAATERESAWREMAKQVAHEIKNPLTPMKLNIQQLQRKWKEGGEDLDKMMEKLSVTLIEQIDVLSNIATEFANFAKMPAAAMKRIDLFKVIAAVVELYRNESDSEIIVTDHSVGDCHLYADHDQMVRVFSNLIKNAIQSIPEGTAGKIIIDLKRADKNIEIMVTDNGAGISPEVRDRIFAPNFTTKSSGTGLGLAIVKNIINNSGGTIRFETEEGSGTTFHIFLPAADS